ncbi:MAG: bifunctional oligoribonuclease/PAP phosphatase NrnA [Haloarculaceae archaeon]
MVLAFGGRSPASIVDAVVDAVSNDPLLPVVALLVVLGAVALAWLVRRWWRRRRGGAGLRRVLGRYDAVSVLMHPNPDPDAMSCAIAVRELADVVDTGATLQYPGQIRHQENRAFETVLDAEFEQVDTDADLAGEAVLLVDHNEPRGFQGIDRVDPVAVVDHHPGSGEGSAFTDVRTDYGACATIFAEYFQQLGYEPSDPEDANGGANVLPSRVASGLLYGILSDTNDLTSGCTDAEFEAASYLFPAVDEGALDRIANPEVDAEVLDVKSRAIRNRHVENPFAFSDVGEVSNVDAIPQAADELLRLEGVTAVVVAGERDGTLHLSGRSRDDRVHMGKVLDAAVENIPMASAGGHARMGGGQVSIEHMNGLGPRDGLTREQFRDRIFAVMAGDR